MLRRDRLRLGRLALLSVGLAWQAAGAQQGGDLQAQILYAYHAEDTNQLASLIQTLSTQVQAGAADNALRYHLAHAEYRFGLLDDESQGQNAESAFTQCVDQLKAVLSRDSHSVEALALQSACYSNLARYKNLEAVLLNSRAADRLNTAYKLAPRNPRVVFLMAMDELAHPTLKSAKHDHVYLELQLAAQLFEQSSATSIEVPGWGDAEAFLEMGRQLQARGDILGARNWIEKSLIAAPDFKAAQKQLATLVRR